MKVIDLLNKIANGEEVPNKIKYDNKIYYIDEIEHFYTSKESVNTGLFADIFYIFNDYDGLNEEVEIIEEDKKEDKKIEKIDLIDDYTPYIQFRVTANKINEIIDYINKGD